MSGTEGDSRQRSHRGEGLDAIGVVIVALPVGLLRLVRPSSVRTAAGWHWRRVDAGHRRAGHDERLGRRPSLSLW